MRKLLFITLFATAIFAKDNYIFDHKFDPMLLERIERLEKEIAELKANNINLKKTQSDLINRYQNLPNISAIKAEVDAIKKGAKTQPKEVVTKVIQPPASYNQEMSEIRSAIENLKHASDQLSTSTKDQTKINRQITLLNERISSLELSARKESVTPDHSAPFSEFVTLGKKELEYLLIGSAIFLLLIFLLTSLSLRKATIAQKRVSQIVSLYQSSSRKIDDKK